MDIDGYWGHKTETSPPKVISKQFFASLLARHNELLFDHRESRESRMAGVMTEGTNASRRKVTSARHSETTQQMCHEQSSKMLKARTLSGLLHAAPGGLLSKGGASHVTTFVGFIFSAGFSCNFALGKS